ncbi:c-type cytochrome [Oscillatoria laete-virens NRMC-F 0139]|jgi:nitric oxide reductase subunit C|nr:c-type cytochrome [Oscillatoria laete-virens]MDL5054077.1 c-type cytochrome [Oscillatoria laete-virens NRMC-F 0139]
MPGTRAFFGFCLVISAAILALTMLTTTPAIRAEPTLAVQRGWAVWRENQCEGCHTLYGQGGAYAPDLTHIYQQRGENYLRPFFVNPGAFHPTSERVMPRFGLTRDETTDLLAFLEWAGAQENARRWPPAALAVSTGSVDTALLTSAQVPEDPVEAGRYWFSRPPAICGTCHALEPDVVVVGPSLAGIATRAGTRVPGQSAETYIRNSILNPGEHVVEGFQNVMAQNLGEVLSAEQINQIIAFLMTLE